MVEHMQRPKSYLFASCVVIASASLAHAETLPVAIQDLVSSHPQILASKNAASGAEQMVKKNWGTYLPSLDLNADTGVEHINSPARRNANLDPYERGRNTYTLTLTEKIWDGGAREAQYASSKHQQIASEFTANSTIQSITYEGISAYLDVLKQVELVKLASQNEANIRKQLKLEDERVRRGSGITVDVLQAKTRLQLAKERRVAFEGAREAAMSRYLQVFGHAAEISTMQPPIAPIAFVPTTLETAIESAIKDNPTLAARRAETDAASENRDIPEAGYLPKIDLVMEHGYENGNDAVIGTRRDYSILVKASWNLFNGMQTRADVQKSAFDYAASRNTLAYTNRKTEEQTRLAWQSLDTAKKRVELLNNAVNIAGEVFTARKKLRASGKETAITVLDAENEVYNAKINHTSANYDMKRSMYQLLLAMGELTPDKIKTN